jgi:hypothetical protein
VIAYAAGAIPETANGGALLFESKKPEIVAALIEKVLTDQSLRESLQHAGKIALKKHLEFPLRDELMKIIKQVAELPPLFRESEHLHTHEEAV